MMGCGYSHMTDWDFGHLSINLMRSCGHKFEDFRGEIHSVDDAVLQANFIRVKSFPWTVQSVA